MDQPVNISTAVSDPPPPPLISSSTSTSIRRSIRPKPAAESLISSPPAIKFYESTIIRKSTTKDSVVKAEMSKIKAVKPVKAPASPTSTKVLKLRMPSEKSDHQQLKNERNIMLSINSNSKENIRSSDSKRNLRVVKLMMPDVMTTEDDPEEMLLDDSPPVQKKLNDSPVKILPLLAPKPTAVDPPAILVDKKKKSRTVSVKKDKGHVKDTVMNEKSVNAETKKTNEKTLGVKTSENAQKTAEKTPNEKTPAVKKLKLDPSLTKNLTKSHAPLKQDHLINEDICSSCGGLGNFICCDSCPRSFHFTCADPPLDPLNLPESDWFCSQCTYKQTRIVDRNQTELWEVMREDAQRMNPKCFVMPRRFRYQPKEEDLKSLFTLVNIPVNVKTTTTLNPAVNTLESTEPIIVNNSILLDHCGIKAPNISGHKEPSGYCHHCNLFGLTRSMLESNSEDYPQTLQRPILACAICPLYWHLDCLNPPLPSFPKPSATVNWTCPLHFTTEKCLALDLSEALVQSTLLLPESAIRLQFERKAERCREDMVGADDHAKEDHANDHFEKEYGVSDTITVPPAIKSFYQQQHQQK